MKNKQIKFSFKGIEQYTYVFYNKMWERDTKLVL